MSQGGGSPTTANSEERPWPARTLIGRQTLIHTARLLWDEHHTGPYCPKNLDQPSLSWLNKAIPSWYPQLSGLPIGSSTCHKSLAELCRRYTGGASRLHSHLQRLQRPTPSSFLPIRHSSNSSALQVTITATSVGSEIAQPPPLQFELALHSP